MSNFAFDMEHSLRIPHDNIGLEGLFHLPEKAAGLIIFAHGSGSSRFSRRNQFIANTLQQAKFATLLFDLLTVEEDKIDSNTLEFRFDIDFLANRLISVTHWVLANRILAELPIGYFGASTGAGAALVAAANQKAVIKAVVSRGGRPDLAGSNLSYVEAPTLLIVGGDDDAVIELNQKAYEELQCIKKLEIVPGATHLFEEPGKLAEVATLANNWFEKFL